MRRLFQLTSLCFVLILAGQSLVAQSPIAQVQIETGFGASVAMDFAPDGQRLAVSDLGGVRIFDLASGDVQFETEFDELVQDVAFLKNGQRLAVALGTDGAVLMDPTDRVTPEKRRFEGHWDSIAANADGTLFSGSNWEMLRAVDLDDGTQQLLDANMLFPLVLPGQNGQAVRMRQAWYTDVARADVLGDIANDAPAPGLSGVAFYHSADSDVYELYYIDTDPAKNTIGIALPAAQTPRLQAFHETDIGPRVVLWGNEGSQGTLRVYDPITDKVTFSMTYEEGLYTQYGTAALSQDGLRLALHHRDGRVDIFATDDADDPEALIASATTPDLPELVLTQGHSGTIWDVSIARGGHLLASLGSDQRLHLTDLARGAQVRSIGRSEMFRFASFDPTAKRLTTVGHSDGFKVWSVNDGKLLAAYNNTPQTVWGSYMGGTDQLIMCGTVSCELGTEADFSRNTQAKFETPQTLSHGSFEDAAVSPDGRYGIVLLSGGLLFVVDSREQSFSTLQLNAEAKRVAVAAGGIGLSALASGRVQAFDLQARTRLAPFPSSAEDIDRITALEGTQFLLSASRGVNISAPDEPVRRFVVDATTGETGADWAQTATAPGIGGVGPVAFDAASGRVVAAAHSPWSDSSQIDIWEIDTDHDAGVVLAGTLNSSALDPRRVVFSDDGATLYVNGPDTAVHWDLRRGQASQLRPTGLFRDTVPVGAGAAYLDDGATGRGIFYESAAQAPTELAWTRQGDWYSGPGETLVSNGRKLVVAEQQQMAILDLADIASGRGDGVHEFAIPEGYLSDPPILSPDGTILVGEVLEDGAPVIRAFSTDTGAILWDYDNRAYRLSDYAFSASGAHVFLGENQGQKRFILSAKTGAARQLERYDSYAGPSTLTAINRLGVGKMMRRTEANSFLLLNDNGTASVHAVSSAGVSPRFVRMNTNGDMALFAGFDGDALIWNWARGIAHPIAASPVSPESVAFSPAGDLMAIAETSGMISLWTIETGARLAQLATLKTGAWAVIADDGRYDASDPGDFPSLSWVLSDAPTQSLPLELFYREFFEPRLLSRLLNGEVFAPLPALSELNRVLPTLDFVDIAPQSGSLDEVTVTIDLRSTVGDIGSSGATTLKLFRNGQLVGQIGDNSAPLIDLQSPDGTLQLHFEDILVPRAAGSDDTVLFEAYAFNLDGIKSETIRRVYTSPMRSAPPKRTAYLISIGVDSHANPAWDLNYAAADAALSSNTIAARLRAEGMFDRIVELQLISSKRDGLSNASRAAIEAVLERLGGRGQDSDVLSAIAGAGQLERAKPDDMVYVFFAGHGLAGPDGVFHLFPQDIAPGGQSRAIGPAFLKHTLSSTRLSELFRAIQAREMVLVIDACNAAASVQDSDFKPGPMGSQSLGQLAYDKAMRVLTASQAEGVALESSVLRHGALSYAMFREGLEAASADVAPSDGRVSFAELLNFAEQRVPALHSEMVEGRFTPLSRGAAPLVTEIDDPSQGQSVTYLQQPSLFDFTRQGYASPIYLSLD